MKDADFMKTGTDAAARAFLYTVVMAVFLAFLPMNFQ